MRRLRISQPAARLKHISSISTGPRRGEPRQHDLLVRLAARRHLDLQVAGGFRTGEQVMRMIDAGVRRIVIGSLALTDPEAFASILREVGPDHLTLALDVRMEDGVPIVATHGWQRGSGETLDDVLVAVSACSPPACHRHCQRRHARRTECRTDGRHHRALSDDRTSGVRRRLRASPILPRLRDTGAARAIVGKAIWERRFTVAQGVADARG